ncbi:MAG: glycosyl hydrolase [Planctomycetota bacterium]|nr:glycosyl hydrolase [Planctomycetota bacterium]
MDSSGPDSGAFRAEDLRDPPACLWPGYFWTINDRMDLDALVGQLRDMRGRDARSVCLHPLPPDFRPEIFATAMAPEYPGEEYMKIVAEVVEECRRLGMNYWLYDEGGWPSGGAAGRVRALDPVRYAPKVLTFEDVPLPRGQMLRIGNDVVAVAVRAGGVWETYRPGQVVPARGEDTLARVFRAVPVKLPYDLPGPVAEYADVLCPDVARAFLEITHERYRRALGKYFGNVIRFVFTDEPAMPHSDPSRRLAWTEDMPDAFRRMKGYDLTERLADLMLPPREDEPVETTLLRIDYYDARSRLFVERFLLPLRDWCRRHGLVLGGHLGGEHEPGGNAAHGLGHILRSLRALDMPGVDVIWRQLFPGRPIRPFVRYASSAARQKGQPLVLSETGAVFGAGVTLAELKWLLDRQYVCGATLFVLANYPLSTRDHFMVFCRPHFGPSLPQWRHIALLHRYAARLSYLLTRGRPDCGTAVYYDVRSVWAGGSSAAGAAAIHDRISAALLENQREFDFVDDDALAGREGRIEGGILRVGGMRYDTVIVPSTRWMDPAALEGLADFVRQGGTLIAVDDWPSADGGRVRFPPVASEDPRQSGRIASPGRPLPDGGPIRVPGPGRAIRGGLEAVLAAAEPVVRLEPPCPDIQAAKRAGDGFAIYFLANSAARPVRVRVLFRESGPAVRCDPVSGRLTRMAAESGPAGIAMDMEFAPWESCAVLFGVPAPEEEERRFVPGARIELTEGWTIRRTRRHRVGERDYIVEDLDESPRPGRLGDWRGTVGEWFSGEAEYVVRFDCPASLAARSARLTLGEVRYSCEAALNGEPLGCAAWPPFEFDITGKLKPGTNVLTVAVTNTLANALLDPDVESVWIGRQRENRPGWTAYDDITRPFERDSLPSGLFGPVAAEIEA